jgi:dTMP kinase
MNLSPEFTAEFKKHPFKGTYIVIEGIDGSGKSTQLEALQRHFTELGRDVVLTSEPNRELIIGQLVRDILQTKVTVPSKAYQYIYTADRVINHHQIVIPALQEGKIVLSHRSFWSAVAHGVLDLGEKDFLKQTTDQIIVSQGILSQYHQFYVADYTFYLEIKADTAMARIERMHKEKELYENKAKLTRILCGYDWLLQTFPAMITAVDGEQPVDKITEEIINNITQ